MLSHAAAVEIEALLGAGLSQRNVAQRMAVSRGTVSRVSRFGAERYARLFIREPTPAKKPPTVEPWRCPECGGKVITPTCLKCQGGRHE